MNHNEIEAKFYCPDSSRLVKRLEAHGAVRTNQRHLERNWRFDLPDRSLFSSGIVFRLRVDPQATLTVKQARPEPLERDEFEIELNDASTALRLVEALGYQVLAIYEKYREQFALDELSVMLDELPFGNFVELEAGSVAALRSRAAQLGLDWEAHVSDSYLVLFDRLRKSMSLPFGDATFANFESVPAITAADLGLRDATLAPEQSR